MKIIVHTIMMSNVVPKFSPHGTINPMVAIMNIFMHME